MLLLPGFIKDSFPYGLVAYLLIDGYAAPQFNQQNALSVLKHHIGVTNPHHAELQQDHEMVAVLDIDKPLPISLSGFNSKSEQGIGSFAEKILNKGRNLNMNGGSNYGYNYYHTGFHARWR